MARHTRRTVQVRKAEKTSTLMPLIALIFMFTGVFVGYFGARVGTAETAHPLHWAITALMALLGYGVGMLWYRIRGDITL